MSGTAGFFMRLVSLFVFHVFGIAGFRMSPTAGFCASLAPLIRMFSAIGFHVSGTACLTCLVPAGFRVVSRVHVSCNLWFSRVRMCGTSGSASPVPMFFACLSLLFFACLRYRCFSGVWYRWFSRVW